MSRGLPHSVKAQAIEIIGVLVVVFICMNRAGVDFKLCTLGDKGAIWKCQICDCCSLEGCYNVLDHDS
jgi:hypothetical protein